MAKRSCPSTQLRSRKVRQVSWRLNPRYINPSNVLTHRYWKCARGATREMLILRRKGKVTRRVRQPKSRERMWCGRGNSTRREAHQQRRHWKRMLKRVRIKRPYNPPRQLCVFGKFNARNVGRASRDLVDRGCTATRRTG